MVYKMDFNSTAFDAKPSNDAASISMPPSRH